MHNRSMSFRCAGRQQGITLITALVVLILVTLMGLASIEDSLLEERMAGNMRNQNVAFQAAEAALREGETYIISLDPPLPDFDGSNGHYPQMKDVLDSMASSWAVGSARQYTGATAAELQTLALPFYIVEQMEAFVPGTSIEIPQAQNDSRYYRITARAVGNNTNTEVILQTIVLRPN